ncbi:unnamed protein product [uncultured bacterium]|nr:unnamed protein product [uncultured bacterium]
MRVDMRNSNATSDFGACRQFWAFDPNVRAPTRLAARFKLAIGRSGFDRLSQRNIEDCLEGLAVTPL